jgi:hypothetical protein
VREALHPTNVRFRDKCSFVPKLIVGLQDIDLKKMFIYVSKSFQNGSHPAEDLDGTNSGILAETNLQKQYGEASTEQHQNIGYLEIFFSEVIPRRMTNIY